MLLVAPIQRNFIVCGVSHLSKSRSTCLGIAKAQLQDSEISWLNCQRLN